MRNHSHCRSQRLRRIGGCAAPRPGRSPDGAKNIEMKPASSSMPSDWYDEKSPEELTKARKHSQQMSRLARGQRFKKTVMDASRPIHVTATMKCVLEEIQKSEGATQKRLLPGACAMAESVSPAGRMPCSPMSPRTWKSSEKNAEK